MTHQLPPPRRCPHCGAEDRIKLQKVIRGETAILMWICAACSSEWMVATGAPDHIDRRIGQQERRQAIRDQPRDRRTPRNSAPMGDSVH